MAFVGYQAEGTLGRQIQRGQDEITLGDTSGPRAERVSLRLNVETVDGFSGHADRQGLEPFVETSTRGRRRSSVSTASVHDEHSSHRRVPEVQQRTHNPKNLETFRLS